MGIFWITESLPLAVTALLPLILFPVLGVIEAKSVARAYFQVHIIVYTFIIILLMIVYFIKISTAVILLIRT